VACLSYYEDSIDKLQIFNRILDSRVCSLYFWVSRVGWGFVPDTSGELFISGDCFLGWKGRKEMEGK